MGARTAPFFLVVAIAALALAGCGTKKLDTGDVESAISDGLTERVGVRPKSVDCPSDITAEKGGKFNCTLTAPHGTRFTVNVTQLDNDGHFRYAVESGQSK